MPAGLRLGLSRLQYARTWEEMLQEKIDASPGQQVDLHAFPKRCLSACEGVTGASPGASHASHSPGSPLSTAATLPTSPRRAMPAARDAAKLPVSPRGMPPMLAAGVARVGGPAHMQSSSTPSVRVDEGVRRGWHVNTGQHGLQNLQRLEPARNL